MNIKYDPITKKKVNPKHFNLNNKGRKVYTNLKKIDIREKKNPKGI